MSDYWYTDEYGRKRHVQEGVSSYGKNDTHYRHEDINSSFYEYSNFSKGSSLYLTSCPECFASVYYCNCSNGGRVFFDTLAPYWDKHPCTTTVANTQKNIYKEYFLVLPMHNYYQKYDDYERRSTIFEVPSFLKSMKINTTDDILYKNLIENTILLLREENGRLYLTIIVISEKFSNERLCVNKKFNNQYTLEIYIISILSKSNLSKSIDISNEIILKKDKKKIIKIDKYQSMRINQVRKNIQKTKTKTKKKKKQQYKPIKETEYISKKKGLKIVKKKSIEVNDDTQNNIELESLEENGWEIKK